MPSKIEQNRQKLLQGIQDGTLKPVEAPSSPSLPPGLPSPGDSRDPVPTPFLRAPVPNSFQSGTESYRASQRNNLPNTRISPLPASLTTNIGATVKSQIQQQQASAAGIGPVIEVNGSKTLNQNLVNFVGTSGLTISSDSFGNIVFTATATGDGLTHGTTPWETDPTAMIFVDDFNYQTESPTGGGLPTSANETGWNIYLPASAGSAIAEQYSGIPPHFGVMQIILDGTSNSGLAMIPQMLLQNTTRSGKTAWPLLDYPGWKMSWVFQFLRCPTSGAGGAIVDKGNAFSLAQTSCYIGLAGSAGNNSSSQGTGPGRPWVFLGLRYDTDPGTALTLSSVANASGGDTVYTGTITGGSNGNFAGKIFTVAGFTNSPNNGTFACVNSTTTTLTLVNASGVSETHAATATTQGISDSTIYFEYVANPSGGTAAIGYPTGGSALRNNIQGQTFNTGVTPVENAWYRLDMVCLAAGVVTLTLNGGGSQLATWTVTCTPIVFGQPTGTGGVVGVANGICAIGPDDSFGNNNMQDSFFSVGSQITVSGTSLPVGTSGLQTCFGAAAGVNSGSIGVCFFSSASPLVNTNKQVTVTGFPALTPYLSFVNDTSASPTANTKSLNVDYFGFAWSTSLATTPLALNAGYSRYVMGS